MIEIFKGPNNRWYKPCFECGEIQSYLRKNYAEESLKLNKLCKKCSNRKTENSHRGWYKGIRISWFNKYKTSAELRRIEFNIDIDYIANLMEKQNFKCALTGIDIIFPEIGRAEKTDASIDRIDNSKGYIDGNVQIVIKKVNMMKQQYSQEEFIKICKLVAKNN
jgi:hypothetical protein